MGNFNFLHFKHPPLKVQSLHLSTWELVPGPHVSAVPIKFRDTYKSSRWISIVRGIHLSTFLFPFRSPFYIRHTGSIFQYTCQAHWSFVGFLQWLLIIISIFQCSISLTIIFQENIFFPFVTGACTSKKKVLVWESMYVTLGCQAFYW